MRKFKKENLLYRFLLTLRESEIKIYKAAFIEQQNNAGTINKLRWIKALKYITEQNKEKKKTLMYNIAANTYIPPVLTNIVPKIQIGNNPNHFYVPKYYIVGPNEYLYGGNFPEYRNSESESVIEAHNAAYKASIAKARYLKASKLKYLSPLQVAGARASAVAAMVHSRRLDSELGISNYTDDNIYKLAIALKIDFKEDIPVFELYKLCMERLTKYSTDSKQIYPKNVVLEYNSPLVEKKKYTSFINYIYRPLLGIKDPGQLYIVYIDTFEVMYGVPFKFNNNIPVYSLKFQNLTIKDFYYIEGPREYEETDDMNFITSNKYILVEYTNDYGKPVFYREGVNLNKIKKAPLELFDSCNRFTNKIDCNDINSYGLENKKCKWSQISGPTGSKETIYKDDSNIGWETLQGLDKGAADKKFKCVSTEEIKEIQKLIDIPQVTFHRINKRGIKVIDYEKTKMWERAVDKAAKNLSQFILIHKLDNTKIKEIAFLEKIQLSKYYETLNKLQLGHVKKLDTIIDDVLYTDLKQTFDIMSLLGTTAKKTSIIPRSKKAAFEMTLSELKQELNQLKIAWGKRIERTGNKDIREELIRLLEESRTRRQLEAEERREKAILTDIFMQTIQLPIIVTKHLKVSPNELAIGYKYLLPDDTEAILTEKSRNEIKFNNGNIYPLGLEMPRDNPTIIRRIIPDIIKENIYFGISKDNNDFLSKLPSTYQCTMIKKQYNVKNKNIEIKNVSHIVKNIPLQLLYLSYIKFRETDPTLPEYIIDLNMIYDTLGTTLNCIYEINSDNIINLESIDIFPATLEAKIYSLNTLLT